MSDRRIGASGAVDEVRPDESAPPERRRRGDLVRTGLRGLGQTFVTLGLVVLLFVVYEVWVSNVFAQAKQSRAHETLAHAWMVGHAPLKKQDDKLSLPAGRQVVLPAGQGFANLYIPALGKDYAYTIVEGTDDAALEQGPGHYSGTAVPGQIGNFAVAGHRVGKGEPFLNLDQLKPGDAVVVQTAGNWYVYRVLGDRHRGDLGATDAQGVPGREIVVPSQVEVIDPVPDHPGQTPTRAVMTMTTCHPKYSANNRMVVHADLARAVPRSGQATPKELGGKL